MSLITNTQSLPQQVFLWIGAEANATEKESALATAQEYLHTHPSGRDTGTPILIIKQGFEPPIFTGWFLAWDPHIWSVRTERTGKMFLLPGRSALRAQWDGGVLKGLVNPGPHLPHSLSPPRFLLSFSFAPTRALSPVREFTACLRNKQCVKK